MVNLNAPGPSRINSALNKIFPMNAWYPTQPTTKPIRRRLLPYHAAAVLARDRISTGAEDRHDRARFLQSTSRSRCGGRANGEERRAIFHVRARNSDAKCWIFLFLFSFLRGIWSVRRLRDRTFCGFRSRLRLFLRRVKGRTYVFARQSGVFPARCRTSSPAHHGSNYSHVEDNTNNYE